MAATANTPRNRRKREDQHLANIGQEGRRTGITVKEHERNDAGFESIDEFFSSASKAPTTARTSRSTRKADSSDSGSESMDIASSTGPDPAEIISARRTRGNGSQALPQSRSPMKTNIGATPRRPPSAGPSHAKMTPQSEGRPTSSGGSVPPLDFSTGDTRSTLRPGGSSPRRSEGVAGASPRGRRSSIYSISPSPERGRATSRTYEDTTGQFTEPDQVDAVDDDGPGELDINDEEQLGTSADNRNEDDMAEVDIDGNIDPDLEDDVPIEVGDDENAVGAEDLETAAGEDEQQPETVDPSQLRVSKRGRGRPRRSDQAQSANQAAAHPKRRQPGRKPMVEKDRNKKTSQAVFKKPALPGVPRALQRPRDETPFEDEDGTTHTRSGRIVYKPLATWKNERAIFEVNEDEHGVPISSITNIVRMDDVTPVKRRQGPSQGQHQRRRKRRRAQTVYEDDTESQPPVTRERPQTIFEDEHDPNDAREPWELDSGVVHGSVRVWDANAQEINPTLRQRQEIAFSSSSIETLDNDEGSFKFAKTLTMAFFGSGIVEIPPYGFKRVKNSRRMQLMFFVHYGKVTVEVSGNRFIISKGGVWQVPRGNFYSIENETEHPAKIFFSQGCEVEAGTEEE